MKSTILRISMVLAATTVGAASCGSDDAAGTATTAVPISSTNYVTLATTPPTLTPATTDGSALQGPQVYTVQAGDYPSKVAALYNVSLDAILAENAWTLNDKGLPVDADQKLVFGTGSAVKIPAGGTLPGAGTVAPTSAPDTGAGTETGTGDTTGGAGAEGETPAATAAPTATTSSPTTTAEAACSDGEYTILAEDTSKIKVANKLGTTVDALDTANAGTKGYSAFYPGLKIKKPC